MAKNFQQTDTDPALADAVACSGATGLASIVQGSLATDGGTAGTSAEQCRLAAPGQTDHVYYTVEIDPAEDVPSGDHIARINPTTTSATFFLKEVHACWWNGSSYSSLGSTTGLSLSMTAIRTVTISSASASPTYSAGDRLYYTFVGSTLASHGNDNIDVTPNQLMTTPISAVIERTLTAATTTDTAQTLTTKKSFTLTAATTTGAAQALTTKKSYGLTPATTTEAAQALTHDKQYTLTPATTTGSAQTLIHGKSKALTPATTTDAAQTLSVTLGGAIEVTLTPATTTDSGQALTSEKQYDLTPATTTDAGQALTHDKQITLTPATTTDAAQTLASQKSYILTAATTTDAAQTLAFTLSTPIAEVVISGVGYRMPLGRVHYSVDEDGPMHFAITGEAMHYTADEDGPLHYVSDDKAMHYKV